MHLKGGIQGSIQNKFLQVVLILWLISVGLTVEQNSSHSNFSITLAENTNAFLCLEKVSRLLCICNIAGSNILCTDF